MNVKKLKTYSLLFLLLIGCKSEIKEDWNHNNMTAYKEKIYVQLLQINQEHGEKYIDIVAVNITEAIARKYYYHSLDTIPNWVLLEIAEQNNDYGWGKQDDICIEYLDVDGINFTVH